MAKFIYLGRGVTNRNCIHEQMERELNSENACCQSVQISFVFLSPEMYKTILPAVLYGCET